MTLTLGRYDSGRLLQYSRVVADEICFHAKESFNVYELFHTRYSLFKQVSSQLLTQAHFCPLMLCIRYTRTAWARQSNTCCATP